MVKEFDECFVEIKQKCKVIIKEVEKVRECVESLEGKVIELEENIIEMGN